MIPSQQNVTIFRGAGGATYARAARCRVLRRGCWHHSIDRASSGWSATRCGRARARPLSLKCLVGCHFWSIRAGRLTRKRRASSPVQGRGRLAAGVKHSSASADNFFEARLAEFLAKRFGSFVCFVLQPPPILLSCSGDQEAARACNQRDAAPT